MDRTFTSIVEKGRLYDKKEMRYIEKTSKNIGNSVRATLCIGYWLSK